VELELLARSVDLTDGVRDHVQKRIAKLQRFLQDIHSMRVELSHGVSHNQGEVFTAQITSWVDKRVLRSEEMHADLFAAIDLAADKMHRQIRRFKDRRVDRWHGQRKSGAAVDGPPIEAGDADDADDADGPRLPRIRRRKMFELYSMTEDEAAEQIELLGHDFFVFRNARSGEVNVLYHRKGGDLGLLETFLA